METIFKKFGVEIQLDQNYPDFVERYNNEEKYYKMSGAHAWMFEFNTKPLYIRGRREISSSGLFELYVEKWFRGVNISFGKGIWQWCFEFELKFLHGLENLYYTIKWKVREFFGK